MLIFIFNQPPHREFFIDFGSDKFSKYYLTHDIKVNPTNHSLTKNGISINYTNHFNSKTSRKIADNKLLTKLLLKTHKIPTPGFYLWNINKPRSHNIKEIKKLKLPLVVKPINGTYGRDVVVELETYNATINVIDKQLKKANKIMVEEMVTGDVFRILVFNNKIIDIYKKEPGYVVGNGISMLYELIDNHNFQKKLSKGFGVKHIEWEYIKKQGYSKRDVIPRNIKIILTHAANVNTGAVVSHVDIETVHPDNIKLFKKINNVCKLNLNGIDYITPSLSIPYYKYGSVIENNARPGVDGHYLVNPDSINYLIKSIKFDKQ